MALLRVDVLGLCLFVALVLSSLGFVSAQQPQPQLMHVRPYAGSTCSGLLQTIDTFTEGYCSQTAVSESIQYSCAGGVPSAYRYAFASLCSFDRLLTHSFFGCRFNTSDCSLGTLTPLDFSGCFQYTSISNATASCDSLVMVSDFVPDFVTVLHWGMNDAVCLNTTAEVRNVTSAPGLTRASQMPLNRCVATSDPNFPGQYAFVNAFQNGTIIVYLYTNPTCDQSSFLGTNTAMRTWCGGLLVFL